MASRLNAGDQFGVGSQIVNRCLGDRSSRIIAAIGLGDIEAAVRAAGSHDSLCRPECCAGCGNVGILKKVGPILSGRDTGWPASQPENTTCA
jgi:hypothetical protein